MERDDDDDDDDDDNTPVNVPTNCTVLNTYKY
jgi:hypothetical protein